jgi:small neutral amino acid transporter SnatA (MarC family)
MDVAVFTLAVALLAGKVFLMRAVWKMATEQGKSKWVCLIASAFCALIVFAALLLSGREAKLHAEVRAAADAEEDGLGGPHNLERL